MKNYDYLTNLYDRRQSKKDHRERKRRKHINHPLNNANLKFIREPKVSRKSIERKIKLEIKTKK